MRTLLGLTLLALLGRAVHGAGLAGDEFPFAQRRELSGDYATGDRFMGIRLLGALSLGADRMNGLPFVELSGLAWDDDDGLLYALSDQGRLFHLRPVFAGGLLVDARLVGAFALEDERGVPVRRGRSDSEGLAIVGGANGKPGDAELIVSFEVVPRVIVYRPDGRYLRGIGLPPSLRSTKRYVTRNKGLEAVTVHPRLGVLTGTEWPFRDSDPTVRRLFSLSGGGGIDFLRHPAPKSALVAIEALPDGSILTLERSFNGLFSPVVIALRRIPPMSPGAGDPPLTPETIAEFDSSRGWGLDNFEGLARHEGMRFFMISDDNQNFFQETLLVYFEILAPGTR